MNDISLNDIDNLVNCACNRLESKIIKSEIMDGSGHTEDIKLYFYDDTKIGDLEDLEGLGNMKDTATKSITEIISLRETGKSNINILGPKMFCIWFLIYDKT